MMPQEEIRREDLEVMDYLLKERHQRFQQLNIVNKILDSFV